MREATCYIVEIGGTDVPFIDRDEAEKAQQQEYFFSGVERFIEDRCEYSNPDWETLKDEITSNWETFKRYTRIEAAPL